MYIYTQWSSVNVAAVEGRTEDCSDPDLLPGRHVKLKEASVCGNDEKPWKSGGLTTSDGANVETSG